jgi:molecular chaperone DnaJ
VLLGVRPKASVDEIKRAYRRLARRYHPDINPGDHQAAELFHRVSLAYQTLVDPQRRQRYDLHGDQPDMANDSAFEFQGFDFSIAVDRPVSTFGDLFGDAVRARSGGLASNTAEAGADLHTTVEIGFEDAIRGVRAAVAVNRLERCAPCDGLGRARAPEARCLQCDGMGQVRTTRGHMVFSRPCPACTGAGVVRHRACGACGGEGVAVHATSLSVDIPAGVQPGVVLIVPGEGHAGRRGGRPGALHLSVHVRPHHFFRRAGDDICLDVPVAFHEAALGARIEVPTIDGHLRMRIPPGTQAGQTFRFRDRGAPAGGRRGDFVVTIRLVLPRVLDERSRELLREFAMRNTDDVREAFGLSSPRPGRPPSGAVAAPADMSAQDAAARPALE